MKTIDKVKKMVALGMGLTMVGATIFGASAVKLSDYPSPFVVNGMPASNLAIVVGDEAAASDTLGAVDVIQGLQQAAVVREVLPGAPTAKVSLQGDVVEIGSPTDLLELNETVGNVRETLTEFDLDMLKGGSITTRRGVTKYNQYLNFNRSAGRTSGKVIFTEDEFDNVGHFLFWNETQDREVFNWVLEFEEGLLTDVGAGNVSKTLKDLNDRDINILGTTYTIVDSEFKGNATRGDLMRLELIGGPVYDALGEGDKKTYTLNGKEYEVEVVIISETTGEVLLKVNGQTLPRMKKAETEPTVDGTLLGIRDIIATGKDTQSSVVRFFLGASELEFKDTNWQDTAYTAGGAVINNEVIEDADVKFSATVLEQDLQGGGLNAATKISLVSLAYRLNADALVGNLYVPPGHGVREYLDEPEGMIAPYWDIRYEGLLDTGVSVIRLNPIGKDEYKLEFVNQEGLQYVVPYLSNRGGTMKIGDDRRQLYWAEGDNTVDYFIATDSYFVLSDVNVGSMLLTFADLFNSTFSSNMTDDTAFTRVLKYESIDTSQQVLTFTDLATGTKQVPYDQGNASSIVVGGITYTMVVEPVSANLSIDMNSDGSRFNGTAVAATEGGALLYLGNRNSTRTGGLSIGGDATGHGNQPFGHVDDTATLTLYNLTIATLSKQFDESGGSTTLVIPFDQRASNRIGINRTQVQGAELLFLTSEPEIAQGLTIYGTFLELFDPLTTDTPEELTIEYPLSQRGVQVFVSGGQVSSSKVEGTTAERQNKIPVGVSKLSSEVGDITQFNAVVVGGPCANPVSARLMNNPEPCWKSVPENQAIVKLYEHANGNVALLVAGRTAMNTRQASRALLTGDIKKVNAKEAVVTGTRLTEISVKAV